MRIRLLLGVAVCATGLGPSDVSYAQEASNAPRPFFFRTSPTAPARVKVEKDAYLTVLAVTPGQGHYAVQVLWPESPTRQSRVKAGATVRPNRFNTGALSHRVATLSEGQPAVFLAFASNAPPDLSSFASDKNWAFDVAINTPIEDPGEFVTILTGLMYPVAGTAFAAARLQEGTLETTASSMSGQNNLFARPENDPASCAERVRQGFGAGRNPALLSAECPAMRYVAPPPPPRDTVRRPPPDTGRRGN